jgi:ribonuclease HI
MELFRSCLDDCGLVDLGYSGPTFTWSNKQDSENLVRVRLDRAVANGAFSTLFDDANVQNIITTTTDHFAVFIRLQQSVQSNQRKPVQTGFRFEAAWLRAPDYRETLENAWLAANVGTYSLQSTWDSLHSVAVSLQNWNRDVFGSVRKEINQLEYKLRAIRLQPRSTANDHAAVSAERRLCELFEREEIMARQRSRVDWLKEGDRNTTFFHARASARRRTNKIRALVRDDGTRCEDIPSIKGMAERFYGDLFTSESFDDAAVIDAISPRVSHDMNDELTKPYLDDEIKSALFQMGPTKAPGPDGFPALFYQTHWDLLKDSVCSAIRGFLMGDGIPEGFCDSVIVLIPKINNPEHLKNFRPISLCNVLYKIASKVLANRLKLILPVVISEHQSAFVPGRLITDNALIAYECLHTIRKQRAKRPFFALKIDMMKAYDRVEWGYLHNCLNKLGFSPEWISTVMKCVTNVRYAVRINGELTSTVVPTRGIRQGDPISPYLFLLCTEGLSSLLFHKELVGVLHGVRNGRSGPPISHLLFADDSIFFARSDPKSVQALKDTLSIYCEGSGQKVNLDKSSVFFGLHCAEQVKLEVMNQLGVANETLQDTYLGMPTGIGRSPKVSFQSIVARVWKRLNGGSDRPLSRAGKETFLKAVIQAIPTYIMSCFQLPVSICDSLRKAISDFWWGIEDGKKKMHWRSWEWLSTPKQLGGMGFRDLILFNQAMLARQCWRLLTDPSSLCAKVLKGRYFPDCDFWEAPQPRSASFTWRSICYGMQLIKYGARWSVGDGKKIKVSTDRWIPDFSPGSFRLLAPLPNGATVDFLLSEDSCSWDASVVRSIFEEDVANQVLQIPISRRGGEDFISWPHTRFGDYTVASGYSLARSEKFYLDRSKQGGGAHSSTQADGSLWKKLWAIKVPGKMKINLWRFAHNCLPSGDQLCRRHIPASAHCIYCNRLETIEHVLLFCQYAREVWEEIKLVYRVHLKKKLFTCPRTWLHDFLSRTTDREQMILTVVFWHLWINRNSTRNGENMRSPHAISEQIKAYAEMIELHLFKPATTTRREIDTSMFRWSPPPEGTVLINVDAAIFSSFRRMGIGIVIRNHNGECLVACSELREEVTAPEMAEALAVRRAMSLADEEGFRKLLVVSDCLSVIHRINSVMPDRSPVGVVIQDIKALANNFSDISFSHVYRQGNEAAHILARSAERFSSIVFKNFAPDCIRQTLCNDLL